MSPSDAEMGHIGDERDEEVLTPQTHYRGFVSDDLDVALSTCPFGATLEERRDYGQYFLSGRGKFVSFHS
jgi:hypothetical protein